MGKFLPFLLVVIGAGCVLAEDDWWEYGHFYQVYPRSFQDSDGDGVGDLKGITSKLSFFKTIHVTGIWLSPIFKSPMKDFGYDISDFREIHEEYGTMEDFDNLVKRCKELDIKLVLDFVPNHCSDKHEWFQKAINPSDPEHAKYKNFFIWHKGKLLENGTRVPPSNWLSIFRGSAWEWNDANQEYYLHQFLEEQPDLNYRNQDVVDEMKETLRFWYRKGVDGFRIDAVPFIFEGQENDKGYYDDEPRSNECNDDPEVNSTIFFLKWLLCRDILLCLLKLISVILQASCYLNHTQTKDLDETFDMIYQWRTLSEEDEFKDKTR